MSKFNVNQNRPLIENGNYYLPEKKYVSINSEDRDIIKFPDPSIFEIELPQDYLNVQSIKLSSWSFPANYNVFSFVNGNILMLFTLFDIYNPSDHGIDDPLLIAIYAALEANKKEDYIFEIETGFYNPVQMSRELENKMNESVTKKIKKYFEENEKYKYALDLFIEYSEFVVAYNSVSQKLNFGNRSSGFTFPNDSKFYLEQIVVRKGICRINPRELPSFANWGLPYYLGFTRCPSISLKAKEVSDYRFYYGDALSRGDNGIWITPSFPGATVYYVQTALKINFMGPAYIYMELDCGTSLNCIDETYPYNLSKFTQETNQTNGEVNASFAKIPVPTTPLSQWFDNDMQPYKWFEPPAERIRRLKIKFRYHNGTLVDFGSFDYSFMLEFSLFNPQIPRNSNFSKNSTISNFN
jgi:hypothetical protein